MFVVRDESGVAQELKKTRCRLDDGIKIFARRKERSAGHGFTHRGKPVTALAHQNNGHFLIVCAQPQSVNGSLAEEGTSPGGRLQSVLTGGIEQVVKAKRPNSNVVRVGPTRRGIEADHVGR